MKIPTAFQKYIVEQEECWCWVGPMSGDGYPQAHFVDATVKVIPWLYRRAHKLHSLAGFRLVRKGGCVAPTCVNPAHFTKTATQRKKLPKRPGVGKGNNPDAWPKVGQFAGEENGRAVVTRAQAKRIRELYESGSSFQYIHRMMGLTISITQVSRIAKGECWPKEL